MAKTQTKATERTAQSKPARTSKRAVQKKALPAKNARSTTPARVAVKSVPSTKVRLSAAAAGRKRTQPASARPQWPIKAARAIRTAGSSNPRELAHALHGLLRTMQHIQQFEESLCSLMHALERGRPGSALLRELQQTLQQLPAHDYLHEVEALRDAAVAQHAL